jgi:hypothetical protein
VNETKEKAKQLQEDNNQIKRDRASALPLIDGTVHLARKSLRLFLAAASLGGHTAAEKVSQARLQTVESWIRSRRRWPLGVTQQTEWRW